MSGQTETTDTRSRAQDRAHPVYVYGIVPAADAGRSPESPGLGGPSATVRTVVEGDMAALVSDLPPDHTPGNRDDLEAHRRVLSDAIGCGTTIPMRFGIVMDGDEVVRQRLLRRHASELGEVLHRLDGHVQMTVKAFYAGDALLRETLASQPELAQESAALAQWPEAEVRAARVQLGEKVAKAVEVRRAEVEAALLRRLSPLAADIQVDAPSSERVALTAQLLVHRDRRAALDAEIHDLSDVLDGVLAFRYVGPLAPFSFADLSLEGDDEEQWG